MMTTLAGIFGCMAFKCILISLCLTDVRFLVVNRTCILYSIIYCTMIGKKNLYIDNLDI